MMKTNYSMIIQWSEIDQIFLVTIPEFVDRVRMPCTEGNTHEEAAKHGLEIGRASCRERVLMPV